MVIPASMLGQFQQAHDGHGVFMVLVSEGQAASFYSAFDLESGETENGRDLSEHFLFSLAQWLAESRFIPSSDNKSMIGD